MSRSSASPEIRDLAQRLLTYEATVSTGPAVLHVSEKLRRPLSTLAGASGFRSLLTRALTLAKAEVPGLSVVQVKPDGSLSGLTDLGNHDQKAEVGVILIAQLLELLVIFIGRGVMLSVLLNAWPDFRVENTLENK